MNDPRAPSNWFKVNGVDALVELALNLHWSWNHAADELWKALDKADMPHSLINSGLRSPSHRRLHRANRPHHPSAFVPLEAGQIVWQR